MEIMIVILIMIIFVLSFYLILLKREIKRTTLALKNRESENSNRLLNKEFDDKAFNSLRWEINLLLKSIHEKELKVYTKNKSLQKMITNMAHDLRTPLTSAIGYIDLLRSKELAEANREKYISIIEERLNRLSYLITNFFEFSKVISRNEELELEKENLIEILENTIANFYEDFSKENRKIDLNCELPKIELFTNQSLLTRIFDNLIINAYKHSNSDLTIHLEKVQENIKIEFINKLEEEKLDTNAMFDEFYTTDISRTKGNTGLGLAIAKEFTQRLNGKIYAEKDKGFLKIILIMETAKRK